MVTHKCLQPIRINICDSTYLLAFVIVSAVASSLFVSCDLPLKFKLERSCTSGRGAQTVNTRPQDSDSYASNSVQDFDFGDFGLSGRIRLYF